MTSEEVSRLIDNLTSGEKYTLLTEPYKPDHAYKFPTVYNSGCNRSFQYKWLDKYPWLIYSRILNGGFCKYCVLFVKNRDKLGVLVNKPFTSWVKVNKIVGSHAANQYHI